MSPTAIHELGTVLKLPWMVTLGPVEAWIALAVWVIVALAMRGAFLRRPRVPD